MCGIGTLITVSGGKREQDLKEVSEIAQSIQNRGPDSFQQFALENGSIHFLGSVLHMQGSSICKQPLVHPDGYVFLWNGEVYDGIEVMVQCIFAVDPSWRK